MAEGLTEEGRTEEGQTAEARTAVRTAVVRGMSVTFPRNNSGIFDAAD